MPVDFSAEVQAVGGGVTQQSDETSEELYGLASLKGGGLLVDLMRAALRDNNDEDIVAAIKREVPKYLYNEGRDTEKIAITELVKRRNEERQKNKVETKKRGGFRSNSVSLFTLTGDYEYGSREVCWDISKRGTVGETILHICLLNNTFVHNQLAKKLVEIYPKLVVDIYIGEEYYGESPLHMALVNEDHDMVTFLLEHGAKVNERCCGNFFTPEDQKSSRTDKYVHEWVEVCTETDYEGLTYWGEYPLAFATCLDQEDSFKLLREEGGADPNMKDNNGNTVLHMAVISNKKKMYDLAFSMGARLDLVNNQGLTPLNLAAKLARKEMFDHILELEREVYWIYGNVTCAAYALNGLDSIDAEGEINDKGALHIIVNQDGHEHLDMMDGLIVNILKEKWKNYARYRFFRRAALFLVYLVIMTVAFYLRPGRDLYPTIQEVNTTINGTSQLVNQTVYNDCYLQYHHNTKNQVRIAFEVGTIIGAILFLIYYMMELYSQKWKNFIFTNLYNAPAKAVFLGSLFCLLLAIPGRIACAPIYEDVMVILSMLMTCPYFLFFLRPFKVVGPFVVMIYKMIRGDFLRFFAIYLVFLIGFSQGMYLVYIGTEDSNLFNHPFNAGLSMFVMSLGEFGDIYQTFDNTRHQNMAKFLFVVYMVLVTLLLINMLIAMMGDTYTMIAETRKEWLRQWAQIVLVIEQTLPQDKRKEMQKKYSQPMKGEKTKGSEFVMRWHHTQKEERRLEDQTTQTIDLTAPQKDQEEQRRLEEELQK